MPSTEFGFHLSLKLACAAEKGGGHTEGKRGVPTLTTKKGLGSLVIPIIQIRKLGS